MVGTTPIFQVLAIAALLRPAATTAGEDAYVWSLRRFLWLALITAAVLVLFSSLIAKPLAASSAMGIILVLLRQAGPVQSAFEALCLGVVVSVLVSSGSG